jgi:hypothetical protein
MPAKQSACNSVRTESAFDCVRLGLAPLLPTRLHLGQHADDVLHMMPDLMRQHIGLREIAGRAKARAEVVVEPQVDVDVSITRAIKRASRGAGKAAGGLNAPRKERQRRLGIAFAPFGENRRPGVFGVGEDGRDEIPHLVCHAATGSNLLTLGRTADGRLAREEVQGVDPQQPGENQDDDDRADSPAAGAAGDERSTPARTEACKTTPKTSAAADVPDIRALPPAPPPHCNSLHLTRRSSRWP